MDNIIYDDKIITPKYHTWDYYYDFIEKLNKKNCIKLGLFCAKISNFKSKENNLCIELVEKWLKDETLVTKKELKNAASNFIALSAASATSFAASYVADAASAAADTTDWSASYAASYAASAVANAIKINSIVKISNINKYLQILLRKTKQFQNNKILEQISKNDVDKLELVDWNMITDIMQEEYNIVYEFEYSDLFSRRCLIELLRWEYT